MKKNPEKKPDYSFVIVYRDRDPQIARRCLDSIRVQQGASFELVFMDYGSNETHSKAMAELLKMDKRFKYYYSDTRGLIWNQGSALNLAISQVLADKIIFVDVDLMLPHNFLETVDKIFQYNQIFLYRAYYLKEDFNQYDQVFSLPERFLKTLNISGNDANSWLIIHKNIIESINKYDEFFRIWGWQDVDFIRRCEAFLGKSRHFIPMDTLKVFHQWHPRGDAGFPKGWKNKSIRYLREKEKTKTNNNYHLKNCPPHQKTVQIEDRPALRLSKEGKLKSGLQFQFDSPKINAFHAFLYQWNGLKSGEYIWVKQKFEFFETNSHSKLAKLMSLINRILSKIKISYRVVDLNTYETELINIAEIRDFIFYFILTHEQSQIQDYYFEVLRQDLCFVAVKQ